MPRISGQSSIEEKKFFFVLSWIRIAWEMSARQLLLLVFVVHHITRIEDRNDEQWANKKIYQELMWLEFYLFFSRFSSISCNLFIVFFYFGGYISCARTLFLIFLMVITKKKNNAENRSTYIYYFGVLPCTLNVFSPRLSKVESNEIELNVNFNILLSFKITRKWYEVSVWMRANVTL